MGKNRVIKSLGRIIGNIIAHKIVAKYTNLPDSAEHLSKEAVEYRDNAIKVSKKFNWNEPPHSKLKKFPLSI